MEPECDILLSFETAGYEGPLTLERRLCSRRIALPYQVGYRVVGISGRTYIECPSAAVALEWLARLVVGPVPVFA